MIISYRTLPQHLVDSLDTRCLVHRRERLLNGPSKRVEIFTIEHSGVLAGNGVNRDRVTDNHTPVKITGMIERETQWSDEE